MKYLLSLGSNLGDRMCNIDKAIQQLSFLNYIKISSIYETKSLLTKDAPSDWDKNFLNLAVSGECEYEPLKLYETIKNTEHNIGRENVYSKWSPRVIDIDILLCNQLVIDSSTLTVPHRSMLDRDFVLLPACNIEPNWIHPMTNKSLMYHLNNIKQTNVINKL